MNKKEKIKQKLEERIKNLKNDDDSMCNLLAKLYKYIVLNKGYTSKERVKELEESFQKIADLIYEMRVKRTQFHVAAFKLKKELEGCQK